MLCMVAGHKQHNAMDWIQELRIMGDDKLDSAQKSTCKLMPGAKKKKKMNPLTNHLRGCRLEQCEAPLIIFD